MNIIEKYLEHIGVTPERMDSTERAKLEEWQEVFQKEITVKDIKKFIQFQLSSLQKSLIESAKEQDTQKSLYLSARIENYQALLAVISQTDKAKESLTAQLQTLMK